MIPVRKPGRPLSTCPCPPGRPCQCGGGVRVAIPKKQKCTCPAGAADGSEESDNETSPTETTTSTSPSRSSFRVSKSGSGSKASSRKQSFDPANFERIDPRTFNLIASPNGNLPNGINGIPKSSPGEAPGLSGLATPGNMIPIEPAPSYITSPSRGSVSMVYNMPLSITTYMMPQPVKAENGGFISTPSGNYISPVSAEPYMNGDHSNGLSFNAPLPSATVLGPSPIPKPDDMASRGGSCCSAKAAPPAPAPAPNPHLQQPIQSTMPPPAPQQNFPAQSDGAVRSCRSCCAGKTQAPQRPTPVNMPPPQQGYDQTFDLPQFSSPVDMKMPDLYGAFQPTQTVFRYPADYGSWQHPISPATWHQVISEQNVPPTAETPVSPATNAANNHAGGGGIVTSHECSCGPGCQCLGCLAHPFNAPMFDYVKQAWGSSANNSANGSTSGSTNGSPTVGPIDMNTTHINNSKNKDIQPPSLRATNGANGSESPPEPPTASNEGSPATFVNGEEQSLPELEFYFVDLPISGFCEGNIALCPCGDDCECVGCVIHGNSPHLPASSMPQQE